MDLHASISVIHDCGCDVILAGPRYLEMDGAPAHTAKVVKQWLESNPRVHLLSLPKSSTHEVNPTDGWNASVPASESGD